MLNLLRPPTTRGHEAGIALLSVTLLLGLVSALLVGYIALISGDQRVGFSSREQTRAYGAAHAGLEHLTSKLGETFATNHNPTCADISNLATTPPDLRDASGQQYVTFTAPGQTPAVNDTSGYRVIFICANGYPQADPKPRIISSGPFEGLRGRATPYIIEVTARTMTASESRMQRKMQTMLVPAFQFGIFSEPSLAFHSGTNFDFGGRVHTNGHLFLAEGNGSVLTLRDRVTAVGEIIRARLPNNVLSSSSWAGSIRIPDSSHTLAATEGSVVDGVGSAENEPYWTNAVSRLNRMITNGRTGARRLDIPLTQMGAQPIDLVQRPAVDSDEDVTNAPVYEQRYYSRAALRILLSDFAADITNLPGVSAGAPLDLSTLFLGSIPPPPAWFTLPSLINAPIATVPSDVSNTYNATTDGINAGYMENAGTVLLRGFIKIERQSTTRVWSDVTEEILSLGFTGRRLSTTNVFGNLAGGATCPEPNRDSIIRLQRVKDDHPAPSMPASDLVIGATGTVDVSCGKTTTDNPLLPVESMLPKGDYYWPNVLYDSREGAPRDNSNPNPGGPDPAKLYMGGVIHYIEIDIRNLARWFAGAIGTTGANSENSDGGYVLYISDRRGNKLNAETPQAGEETGEYGNEDVVNLNSASGTENNDLDAGEDANLNGGLDFYGKEPYDFSGSCPGAGPGPSPLLSQRNGPVPIKCAADPWTRVSEKVARKNAQVFFRRAVKLVNGADILLNRSNLSLLPGTSGLTIVSENPVYVQGNYNTGTSWGTGMSDHRGSAIIADAITLLSNSWNDIRSFTHAHNPANQGATTTWYRFAAVAGKTPFFPKQPGWGSPDAGSDGGVHNFLRFLEDWGGDTVNYRGSILSFYYSRQANGIFKYSSPRNVYDAPARNFSYDTEFLDFALLPPKPPSFRDVNTLTFRQILRPTQ